MDRPDTLPYENFFPYYPQPYLQPGQSKYHNLGFNAFTPYTEQYPGKNLGVLGDYGPRQMDVDHLNRNYPYPTDQQYQQFNVGMATLNGHQRNLPACIDTFNMKTL